MATGADYSSLTSFGFLNDPDVETQKVKEYEDAYDVVIRNDGDLHEVTKYLKRL
jgi:hypothetical protein